MFLQPMVAYDTIALMPDALLRSEIAFTEHCERVVLTRYWDARARGLTHAGALAEAAGLLWALRPSLPADTTRRAVEEIVMRDRPA